MADRAEQVSTTGLVDTKQQPGATKRRQYSEALKRQLVAETQAPGASVSIVARRHDVNSNQLFKWRRELLPKAVVESGAMVPVTIAPDGDRPRRTDRERNAGGWSGRTLIAVTGTTGRSSARVIAIEEPTGASCSRTAAVTVFRRTVPTMAPAAENARHGEKRDGDSRDFGQKPVRC
jgi:transposase-like protein